jgi:zinc transporter ZupT
LAQSILALFFVAVTFFSTLVGGLFTLRNTRLSIKYFFAFAAGALLGVAFFDLMPEVIDIITTNAIPTVNVMISIVVAFLFFHVLDRIIVIHAMSHGHMPAENNHTDSPLLVGGMVRAGGLSIHSFLDGVAIGTAFHIGVQFGLVVGLAVVFHDFSDGLNTVTVMLRAGSSRRGAYSWLLLDAVTPSLGALATFLFSLSSTVLAIVLAFFVGEFLYIGAADLLPEAHQRGTSLKLVLATIIGVSLIFGVTRFLNL